MEPLGSFLTVLESAHFFNVWPVSDSYISMSSGPAVCHTQCTSYTVDKQTGPVNIGSFHRLVLLNP